MRIRMYAIKDELNGFSTPIPFMNEELAKRYLKDQTLGNPTFMNSPEDFSLWFMGEFDTEDGLMYRDDSDPQGIHLVERSKNYVSN